MKSRYIVTLAAVCSAWSLAASAGRDPGWEFGGELIYQDSKDVDFEGGSSLSLDSDVGLAITFGYRFSSKLELTMGLDWNNNNVDYKANLISADLPNLSASADGTLESFTPRVGVNFNFLEGPITPFVNGTIGYSFIDTNIPDGPPQSGCWWDPWYGQICGTWQPTKSVDEFMYGAGIGVRWDISPTMLMRFAYEKHWLDLGTSTSTPDFDQLKLGFSFSY